VRVLPRKNCGPKTVCFSLFLTTSRFHCKYFRSETYYRQSVNDVGCPKSDQNIMNFGPQIAKIGPSVAPPSYDFETWQVSSKQNIIIGLDNWGTALETTVGPLQCPEIVSSSVHKPLKLKPS